MIGIFIINSYTLNNLNLNLKLYCTNFCSAQGRPCDLYIYNTIAFGPK